MGSTVCSYHHAVGTGQVDSPTVKSRTSCPSWRSPRANASTTSSVPPYRDGGTARKGGTMSPIRMTASSGRPVGRVAELAKVDHGSVGNR